MTESHKYRGIINSFGSPREVILGSYRIDILFLPEGDGLNGLAVPIEYHSGGSKSSGVFHEELERRQKRNRKIPIEIHLNKPIDPREERYDVVGLIRFLGAEKPSSQISRRQNI